MTAAAAHVIRLLDVGDSLDLERMAEILRAREPTRGATVLRGPEPSPSAGVVLAREPLDLRLGPLRIGAFDVQARLRAFDFGVVAFRFSLPIADATAPRLVALGAALAASSAEFDAQAHALWREMAGAIEDALHVADPALSGTLLEDYTVFVLPERPRDCPDECFAHLLLGEPNDRKLAPENVRELAKRAIRYYEDDLVLIEYDAAVIVDRTGALDLVEIFEIACAQLLELRYYDALLGRSQAALSADVRRARDPAWLVRSPFLRLSRRAAVFTLEVAEMTDRLERAITLVGDTYTVLVYRETALRFRLAEMGAAVRDKIGLVARVSEVLGRQVQSRRDFLLEALVVVLIAVEVVVALR